MPYLLEEEIKAPAGWEVVNDAPAEVVEAVAAIAASQQEIAAAIDDLSSSGMTDSKARRAADQMNSCLMRAFDQLEKARVAADSDSINPAHVVRSLLQARTNVARASQMLMLTKRVRDA